MENDGGREERWDVDLEAVAGANIKRLREIAGISQRRLGADLGRYGLPMHQTTVAKLEAGGKPLRLNELAVIASFFKVSVESLWEKSGELVNKHELAVLARRIASVEDSRAHVAEQRATARDAVQTAAENLSDLHTKARDLEVDFISLERESMALRDRLGRMTRGLSDGVDS